MNDHYYTVAEVAELTGLTKQAIYKRLDKDLAKYLSPTRGKKLLHEAAISALRDVSTASNGKVEISTDFQPEISNASTDIQPEQVETSAPELKIQLENSTIQPDFLNFLKSENARLNAVIAEKDAVIAEYAEKFAAIAAREQELTEKSMSITSQAQTLHLLAAADNETTRTWREKLAAFILGKNKK